MIRLAKWGYWSFLDTTPNWSQLQGEIVNEAEEDTLIVFFGWDGFQPKKVQAGTHSMLEIRLFVGDSWYVYHQPIDVDRNDPWRDFYKVPSRIALRRHILPYLRATRGVNYEAPFYQVLPDCLEVEIPLL